MEYAPNPNATTHDIIRNNDSICCHTFSITIFIYISKMLYCNICNAGPFKSERGLKQHQNRSENCGALQKSKDPPENMAIVAKIAAALPDKVVRAGIAGANIFQERLTNSAEVGATSQYKDGTEENMENDTDSDEGVPVILGNDNPDQGLMSDESFAQGEQDAEDLNYEILEDFEAYVDYASTYVLAKGK